jgi:hypothetical protein
MVGDGAVLDGVPVTEADGEPPEPESESATPPDDTARDAPTPRVAP